MQEIRKFLLHAVADLVDCQGFRKLWPTVSVAAAEEETDAQQRFLTRLLRCATHPPYSSQYHFLGYME